jgi:hypothetical protein
MDKRLASLIKVGAIVLIVAVIIKFVVPGMTEKAQYAKPAKDLASLTAQATELNLPLTAEAVPSRLSKDLTSGEALKAIAAELISSGDYLNVIDPRDGDGYYRDHVAKIDAYCDRLYKLAEQPVVITTDYENGALTEMIVMQPFSSASQILTFRLKGDLETGNYARAEQDMLLILKLAEQAGMHPGKPGAVAWSSLVINVIRPLLEELATKPTNAKIVAMAGNVLAKIPANPGLLGTLEMEFHRTYQAALTLPDMDRTQVASINISGMPHDSMPPTHALASDAMASRTLEAFVQMRKLIDDSAGKPYNDLGIEMDDILKDFQITDKVDKDPSYYAISLPWQMYEQTGKQLSRTDALHELAIQTHKILVDVAASGAAVPDSMAADATNSGLAMVYKKTANGFALSASGSPDPYIEQPPGVYRDQEWAYTIRVDIS